MKKEKSVLLDNTIMLYIMRFSTYFFGFITVPYQTRILGKAMYGKIAAAMALMLYFQLLIDFGFILSGTQEIAKHQDEPEEINHIYSSVQLLKIGLMGLSALILGVLLFIIPTYREDPWFYWLYLLGTVINGFVPDFVYRGLQKMRAVTARLLISRMIFTICIFIFLKKPEDYMMIPLLSALGNAIAMIWSVIYLRKRFNVKLTRVEWSEIKRHAKISGSFFLSRIAGTVYSSLNLLILEHQSVFSSGSYAVADKLLTTGQSGLAPISDSVYPYMIKNRDFKFIRKILLIMMPIIAVFCGFAFVYAGELCAFVFGVEYYDSGEILRLLLPAAVMTLPDYLYGFPCMAALGVSRYANYSIFISSGIHLSAIFILYITNYITPYTLAFLVSLSTFIDLIFRYSVTRYFYHKYEKGDLHV